MIGNIELLRNKLYTSRKNIIVLFFNDSKPVQSQKIFKQHNGLSSV